MNKNVKYLAGLILSVVGIAANAATDWSTQDYDLYAGNFNGDAYTDLLYVAKDPTKSSGIALSDGSTPNISYQSWASNYLGIAWHGNQYVVHVGDFSGDGRADVFLQTTSGGTSYVLHSDTAGRITGISASLGSSALGLTWSADQHKIVVGDFSGDGKSDLFLQATTTSGTHAIVLADSNGQFTSGPQQSWTDSSWSAFKWSTRNAVISTGDFNGDSRADLLVQARPNIVMIDYEIPIPVPVYAANSFGLVHSQGGSTPFLQPGVQQWSRNAHGVDWSPLSASAVVGDFNGDTRDDVFLQGGQGRASYLLTGNASGAALSSGSTVSSNVGITRDSASLIAGNFNGNPGAGLYFQANAPTGTNYIANSVGASISAVAHTPGTPVPVSSTSIKGRTVGNFAVTAGGAAIYRIPLWTPPAVNNTKPALTLTYNSVAAETNGGMFGPGWSLEGLSFITRCVATVAQNDTASSVTLSYADRYCLDGNQLRLITGTYGAAGSTYRTELDVFSQIAAVGTYGNGPSQFVVKRKDGLTFTYNNVGGLTGWPEYPSLITYPLASITDRDGQGVTFEYQGGHLARMRSGPYGFGFHGTIEFIKGSGDTAALVTTIRGTGLEGVEGTIRNYKLDYAASPTTGRQRLVSITECADDALTNCFAPTIVSYQNGQAGIAAPSAAVGSGQTTGTVYRADVDGDGKSDLIFSKDVSGSLQWWVQRAAGGSPINTGAVTYTSGVGILVDDFLASGEAQLLAPDSNDVWHLYRWNGSSFSVSSTSLSVELNAYLPWFPGYFGANAPGAYGSADIDADGRPDLVWAESDINGQIHVHSRLNTSSAGAISFAGNKVNSGVLVDTHFNGFYGNNSFANTTQQAMDFNGDLRDDLFVASVVPFFDPETFEYRCSQLGQCENPVTPYLTQLLSQDGNFSTPLSGAGSPVLPVNWNGDECTDFLWSGTMRVSPCNGDGLQSISILPAATGAVVAVDWDHDGRDDLLSNSSGVLQLHRSTGLNVASPVSTGLSATSGTWIAFDRDGDGLDDVAVANAGNNYEIVAGMHNGAGQHPDVAATITDGYGIGVTFTYASTAQAAYSRTWAGIPAAQYPLKDVTEPRYVVSQTSASDGAGGNFQQTHLYGVAREDVEGRGFLGFGVQRSYDARTQLYTVAGFKQEFPFTGALANAKIYRSDLTTLVDETTNTWQASILESSSTNKRQFPYLSSSTTTSYEVGGVKNGQPITTRTTAVTVDTYGNATQIAQSITDNDATSPWHNDTWQNVIVSTITNYPDSDWCLGRPTQVASTRTLPGGSTQTQTTGYTVDSAKCRITQVIQEPAVAALRADATYAYDACGNINSVQVVGRNSSGASLAARTTTIDNGSANNICLAPLSVTDAMGKTTQFTYQYGLGVRTSATDPNGLIVNWTPDAFGGITREARPDETATDFSYFACTAANNYCNTWLADVRSSVEIVERDSGDGAIRTVRRYLDGLDRVRRTASQTANGDWSYVDVSYDSLGRTHTVSNPYTFASNGGTRFSYDVIGRETKIELTDASGVMNRQSTTAYAGRTVTTVDAKGYTSHRIVDVTGETRRLVDPSPGGTTSIDYIFSGGNQLTTITDAAGNQNTATTNRIGLKTGGNDVDMGSSSFQFNSLGELESQTDAKLQTTTFTYDPLGRPYQRTDHGGGQTTWTWGGSAASKNIGRLESVVSTGYQESYLYDSAGRTQKVTYAYSGIGSFEFDYAYNAQGRLDRLTYPISTASNRLQVQYLYAYGSLTQVKEYGGAPFWTLNASDERGVPVDESLGNGVRVVSSFDPVTGLMTQRQSGASGSSSNLENFSYNWDLNGNLTQRQSLGQSLSETFQYDALNRMHTSTVAGQSPQTQSFDAIGNVVNKSDVGGGSNWTYHSSKKHAVTSAGGVSYAYDDNGNMTQRGAGDAITWTPFNLPSRIDQGSNYSEFSYGAHRNRFRQVANYNGSSETTVYAGGLFEKVTVTAGTIYRHYIPAGSATVVYTRSTTQANPYIHYVSTDHLSSTSAITNESGALVVRESFDRYGKRRDAATWSGAPSTSDMQALANVTRDGFTGHEHLDNLALIHMNGRVYDPGIGRFISADPFLDAGLGTQGLNRYGYVGNNPLTLIDPSGYQVDRPEGGLTLDFCDNNPDAPMCPGGFTNDPNNPCFRACVHHVPLEGRGELVIVRTPTAEVRGSTVGGTGWGQTIINSTVPGAYYAGQAELAFRDGRYVLGTAHSVASVLEAGIGVFTLGRSTAALSATRTVATQGTATIYRHGSRHVSILVRSGDEVLHTHQVVASSRFTTIATAETAQATEALTISLPNARAAMQYQRSVLGTPTGIYNDVTNSCVTHCGDVLRAGGVEGVPETTRGIIRWLQGLMGR